MSDLIVFAVIGLLFGAAARLFYPGREPVRVLGTLVLGMTGAVLGGLISWAAWPAVDGQLYPVALLTSLIGAVVAVTAWACISYGRRIARS